MPGLTTVVTLAVLSLGSPSVPLLDTLTRLVRVPLFLGTKIIVAVAVLSSASQIANNRRIRQHATAPLRSSARYKICPGRQGI